MTLPRCPTCDGFVPPSLATCPNCEPAAVGGFDAADGWVRFGILLRMTAGSAVAMTLMACYGAPPDRFDVRDPDPKAPTPGEIDAKVGDPKGGDPKSGEPKGGDPKVGDPKDGDPKVGEPKGGEPKGGEPKGDAKAGDPDAKVSPDDAKGATPGGTPPP